jgi:hypothetical protein
MLKKCPRCDNELDVDFFYVSKQTKSGFTCYCKECVKSTQKSFYDNNIEKYRKYANEHSKDNLEKKEYARNYSKNNRDILNASNKRWKANNKDYMKNKRASDPLFKMAFNLRSRIRKAFISKSWRKNCGSEILIGCDWSSAHHHLENQFSENMSWDNYGKWHIDHVIPLSFAKTEEELIKLCHYSNLQPLWAKDNLSKNKKIIEHAIYT